MDVNSLYQVEIMVPVLLHCYNVMKQKSENKENAITEL